jgi:2-polyprenyl-3-methyl-5-hydroxy-6-metoxy-1,4-benzoquinol methylase
MNNSENTLFEVASVKRKGHMTFQSIDTNKDAELMNLKFWNEVAPIHFKSYDIDALHKRISHIDLIQKAEIYPINGKDILHLQCHIGTDTLSLEIDGATVTGVDFSEESIKIAKQLRSELGLKADFIQSNILELKDRIDKQFDIVYTSQGVLAWIRDIDEWAKTIKHFLKPDGFFYIQEIHPFKYVFDDTVENKLIVKHSYFHKDKPTVWGDDGYPDYSDESYVPKNLTYEWTWTISDIINSLIRNGLQIVFFNEHDKLFYQGFSGMRKDDDGWWILENYKNMIPFTFSLKAQNA